MAKRKPANSQTAPADEAAENLELESAVEEVRAARARLREARERYEQLLRAAAGDMKQAGESSPLRTAVCETLDLVKKYPGPGLICAGLVGFFLGRLFRR